MAPFLQPGQRIFIGDGSFVNPQTYRPLSVVEVGNDPDLAAYDECGTFNFSLEISLRLFDV